MLAEMQQINKNYSWFYTDVAPPNKKIRSDVRTMALLLHHSLYTVLVWPVDLGHTTARTWTNATEFSGATIAGCSVMVAVM